MAYLTLYSMEERRLTFSTKSDVNGILFGLRVLENHLSTPWAIIHSSVISKSNSVLLFLVAGTAYEVTMLRNTFSIILFQEK